MARNVFRNGASLYRVIENSPIKHLKAFLLQADENFKSAYDAVEGVFAGAQDDETVRTQLLTELTGLPGEKAEPVEVECQRVLQLAETKGPTSLQTIVDRQLNHEQCMEFSDQPDDLAKSLWAHVHHRQAFDDAVSFKAIRSWRNADRLFAAFNVDLDGSDNKLGSEDIDTDKLSDAVGKKFKTTRAITISVIDLPRNADYPPSVLVIVRFAGQQASMATHGERGERRIIYFLPQDEAILIYTPADERIEVAATRAIVRNTVAECFATATLGHDVSTKPLTSAAYETHRFLTTMDLALPELDGFTVFSAKVVDIELRIENWQSRLAIKVGGNTDMATLVERYLSPGHVLRRALGVSRILMAVTYARSGEGPPKVLEIMISDGNRCSLNSERDPVVRKFGRRLLEAWEIVRAFRDLDKSDAIDLLPVMVELWDLDQTTQRGGFFSTRGIATKPLEDAWLIRRKEVEPKLTEEEDDPEVDGPTLSDRTIYTIDLEWMHERLLATLKGIVDANNIQELSSGLAFLGIMQIDDRDVPCYLARGLDVMKIFLTIDERLRARAGAGPGIVFTGRSGGPTLIGANVVIPLISKTAVGVKLGVSRDAIESAFRAGRSLALGAGTLELIEDEDGVAGRLYVPGSDPLDVFGEHPIRAFRLLVDAAKKGLPGVASGKLIEGSGSGGFQQMISTKRWPVVEAYLEKIDGRRWKLKGF
jgi:hypothetical protein